MLVFRHPTSCNLGGFSWSYAHYLLWNIHTWTLELPAMSCVQNILPKHLKNSFPEWNSPASIYFLQLIQFPCHYHCTLGILGMLQMTLIQANSYCCWLFYTWLKVKKICRSLRLLWKWTRDACNSAGENEKLHFRTYSRIKTYLFAVSLFIY